MGTEFRRVLSWRVSIDSSWHAREFQYFGLIDGAMQQLRYRKVHCIAPYVSKERTLPDRFAVLNM